MIIFYVDAFVREMSVSHNRNLTSGVDLLSCEEIFKGKDFAIQDIQDIFKEKIFCYSGYLKEVA